MQPAHTWIGELRERYPSIADDLINLPAAGGDPGLRLHDVPAGTLLFAEGAPCAGFPFVLEGEIRVVRLAGNGRSLELYRVLPGEICVVSAMGLIAHRPLSAQGQATVRTRFAMVTPARFDQWCDQRPFRQFVFDLFAQRMGELMGLVEAVAFQRLDRRLAEYLLGRGQSLHITHQALADELGTVREIITRLLHRFEAAGIVALGRERIEIQDPAALREFAAGDRHTL